MLLVAVVLLTDVLLATLPVEVVRVVLLLPVVLLDDARLVSVVLLTGALFAKAPVSVVPATDLLQSIVVMKTAVLLDPVVADDDVVLVYVVRDRGVALHSVVLKSDMVLNSVVADTGVEQIFGLQDTNVVRPVLASVLESVLL